MKYDSVGNARSLDRRYCKIYEAMINWGPLDR